MPGYFENMAYEWYELHRTAALAAHPPTPAPSASTRPARQH